jgi:hypothetical protein
MVKADGSCKSSPPARDLYPNNIMAGMVMIANRNRQKNCFVEVLDQRDCGPDDDDDFSSCETLPPTIALLSLCSQVSVMVVGRLSFLPYCCCLKRSSFVVSKIKNDTVPSCPLPNHVSIKTVRPVTLLRWTHSHFNATTKKGLTFPSCTGRSNNGGKRQ